MFHWRTPKFEGVETCLYCGGRYTGCCPVNGKFSRD